MRIGIFGGSFNPPHKMHKNIALELIKNNYVDKIIFIPTGNLYPKEGLASGEDRYCMLRQMIKGYPELDVSDYEIKETRKYTYETLDYFKKMYPKDTIYFILGADNYFELPTWKNYTYLIDTYHFLVIDRENRKIKANNPNIRIAPIERWSLSSTEVRHFIKQKNKRAVEALDDSVFQYIKLHNLYT